MDAVVLALSVSGGNFLATAVVHLCLCRMKPSLDRLSLLVRLLPITLASTVVTTHVFRDPIVTALRSCFVTSAVTAAAVASCLLFVAGLSFYSAITHSVRLRIATLVAQAPGGRQSVADVVARYDAEQATRCRVEQMVDGGYVVQEGDVLRLTRKGAVVAAVSTGGKRLFNVGLGG